MTHQEIGNTQSLQLMQSKAKKIRFVESLILEPNAPILLPNNLGNQLMLCFRLPGIGLEGGLKVSWRRVVIH